MAQTFEELVGQELDPLYQGALFLAAGDARVAERLLVEAVSTAFQEYPYREEIPSAQRWLEARLARAFLERHPAADSAGAHRARRAGASIDPASFDRLGPDELFEAAGTVPARARAALWLVLLRRWSYAAAASAIGVERDALVELLGYRDVLIQAVQAAARGRRGLMGSHG